VSWRARMRQWAGERGRQAQQLAVQGYERARLAGRKVAAKVTAIQKSAGLNAKLMTRSLESVRRREHVRDSDRAFRDGYVQQATPRQPVPNAQREPSVSADQLLRQDAQALADSEGAGVLVASDRNSTYLEPCHDRGGMPPGAIPAGKMRPLPPERGNRGFTRTPPGHARRIGRGDFASQAEADEALGAWRDGASFSEYLGMGTGRDTDREAGQ
jgi:hypothetical protein